MGAVEYRYANGALGHHHAYLLPAIDAILSELAPRRVFDLGCGNGSVAHHLASFPYDITGIDGSDTGIAQANSTWPHLRLEVGSAYEDLAGRFGSFDAVVSLEVVEHLYDPRLYARRMFDLVRPGGGIVVSTPYHGYWKNFALALTGRMDDHFTALWDGGHIKFWSVRTLTVLLNEVGFRDIRFRRVGRIPLLAKSMIAIARRP
jgi:2-polyprenyl-6-hydroxyphenyl methylase/3-demethylubiquinone-9 3-methyltransferase